MNRTALKNYAPQARRAFIQAITDRAAYYGLTRNKIEPVVQKGDVAVIAGREHPRAVAATRKQLEERIKRYGFEPTMEAIGYTWFNRLVAIRFMELHGYLEHGYRVLSSPEGKATPEILEQAENVALAGMKHDAVIDLKLAGNKEGELYRLLLTAQCNALHAAMPFLFERIDDETELLLPDNLLHSDSLIRKLVSDIDEEDWQQVEIIGWLYQFYISEKKDEVIGKVVASEDIPSATQLFTPNWIVKYLVQNTLGRQWLTTYPQSALRQQMKYYIEPAEQIWEVREQVKAITPTSLNPEELTLLDPACGSGHILVEAYDLFKAIYQERGYRAKDIPGLILQKNLYGLEIDNRAAQLAAFALMMKARADDRRIFDSLSKPNILAVEDSNTMNASDITHALNSPIDKEDVPSEYLFEEIQEDKDGLFSKKALAEKAHVSQSDIASLLDLFGNAKTFGSLIQIPQKMAMKLPEIEKRLDDALKRGNLTHAPAHVIKPLLHQARLLTESYDNVVANPPYMGSKYFTSTLKSFVADHYDEAKADLYACFIQRNLAFAKPNGYVGMITIPNWMFLSSFERVRHGLLTNQSFDSFLHNGRGVFGSDFGSCAFVIRNTSLPAYKASYRRLFDDSSSVSSNEVIAGRYFSTVPYLMDAESLQKIPGNPLAYWLSSGFADLFVSFPPIEDIADSRQGLATGGNDLFMRFWHEVSIKGIGFGIGTRKEAASSGLRWFPCNKGGPFRRWYGNFERVVDWKDDGQRVKSHTDESGFVLSRPQNQDVYFRNGITWSDVTISNSSFRLLPKGFISDATGHSAYFKSEVDRNRAMCFCNTTVAQSLVSAINPTVHFHIGYFKKLPLPTISDETAKRIVEGAVGIAKEDWDSVETSWDFQSLLALKCRCSTLRAALEAVELEYQTRFSRLKDLEQENNRLFIEACRLQDELSFEVPEEQITLYRPEREEDTKRVISYAMGCIMGRYSLDKPGLIYAHCGNKEFDPRQYQTFPADNDGIIPLVELDWGMEDDGARRLVEFIGVVWPKEHLEENLKFVADNLGPSSNEQPRETIRRYIATSFYKHHLSMYKRRPIYWLFSSGKQRAFQCLVYLHRYHEGTLARIRTEYVIPLQGQIAARVEQLEADKVKATSTSHRNKLQKEQTDLKKQQAELLIFEEKLKHVADQKVTLDLDDGVKVNYAKFADLLAESKAITGGKDDE